MKKIIFRDDDDKGNFSNNCRGGKFLIKWRRKKLIKQIRSEEESTTSERGWNFFLKNYNVEFIFIHPADALKNS